MIWSIRELPPRTERGTVCVALTLEQCIEYDLLSAPLKPSEKRKAKWQAQTGGREQTELDALMTLRRGAFEKLLHAAIGPFYDPALDQRCYDANATPNHVREWFEALPAYTAAVERMMPLRDAAIEAVEAINNAAEEHAAAVHKVAHEAEEAPRSIRVAASCLAKMEEADLPPLPLAFGLIGWLDNPCRPFRHRREAWVELSSLASPLPLPRW